MFYIIQTLYVAEGVSMKCAVGCSMFVTRGLTVAYHSNIWCTLLTLGLCCVQEILNPVLHLISLHNTVWSNCFTEYYVAVFVLWTLGLSLIFWQNPQEIWKLLQFIKKHLIIPWCMAAQYCTCRPECSNEDYRWWLTWWKIDKIPSKVSSQFR